MPIDLTCLRCDEDLIEIPADEADWLCSTLYVTYEGTWSCGVDDADGRARLHTPGLNLERAICRHCGRRIVNEGDCWYDPEAGGDDSVWRETCDKHDTLEADHEP